MSSIRAGAAYVELSLRQGAFVKGLKNAERQLSRSATKMRDVGSRILKVGGALASPFVAAVVQASRMEETMAKFNVVFGDSAESVKDWSDVFAERVGRSRQQIADFMASSQDLFVPLGFDPQKATELSKVVTGLAVDLASFNNMSDADAQRDLQAALTGSGEVMKKYGVIVSEAAVKQELLNQGLDPKIATNQQKVQARLNIILKGTTAAQGDAVRSGTSLANSWKRLQGNILNTFESIGTPLLSVTANVVNYVSKILVVVGSWIEQNKQFVLIAAGVVAAVIGIGTAVYGIGIAMAVTAAIIGGAVSMMGFLATAMAVVVSVAGGVITAIAAVASPIGILIAVIGAAVLAWFNFSESGGQALETLGNYIGTFGGRVFEVLSAIAKAFITMDFAGAASIAFTAVQSVIAKILGTIFDNWKSTFQGMITVVAVAMKSAVGLLIDGIFLINKQFLDTRVKFGLISKEAADQQRKFAEPAKEFLKVAAGGQIDNAANTASGVLDNVSNALKQMEVVTGVALDAKVGEAEANFAKFDPFKNFKKLDGVDIPAFADAEGLLATIKNGQSSKKLTSAGSFSGAVAGRQGANPINTLIDLEKRKQDLIAKREARREARDKARDELLKKRAERKLESR